MTTEPVSILVIDDSEDDRLLYRRTLKKIVDTGYHMLEADNGEEGLAHIRKEMPACVLLDYSLPGYNGVEVLKQIRAFSPFIPVVMLTGQGNENVAVTAMQEGAQNYISKSTITPESLDHTIKVAIKHCTLQKRIDEQRTSLEVFTRALAHDLKEPVRTIRSFTELILEGGMYLQEGKGYFQHIQNAADRMHMLIDTVFLYTRLDDPGQMVRENCDTTGVLAEVKENLSQLIREHNAVIEYGPLPDVYANRIQLAQVLQNLLSNAIYHSQQPVKVVITAEARGDHWLFRVEDNGPGVNEAHIKKIFEPFKRLVHHEKGAGIGLATCKKIVESHGGKIWCESHPGGGAVFLFTLPGMNAVQQGNVDPSVSHLPVDEVKAACPDDLPLANILLVDDREADIDLTRIKLIDAPGLQCGLFTATSAEEALDRLHDKENPIDVMLLDINMPDIDGFELLARMQETEGLEQVAVIMCTGSTYDKDREKSESLGAAGYLVKPGQFEILQPMIKKAANVHLSQKDGRYFLFRSKR